MAPPGAPQHHFLRAPSCFYVFLTALCLALVVDSVSGFPMEPFLPQVAAPKTFCSFLRRTFRNSNGNISSTSETVQFGFMAGLAWSLLTCHKVPDRVWIQCASDTRDREVGEF